MRVPRRRTIALCFATSPLPRDMTEPPAAFFCECPACGQERVLTGFSNDELADLLRTGADIEAYCSSCDVHWPMSTEERADLARALSRTR